MREDVDEFAELSAILWDQREALEFLLFKLTEEQLVVAGGHRRWLPRADAEVRDAVEQFRLGEVGRAVAVQALATTCGLPADATLPQLANTAPAPWDTLLLDHHTALGELAGDVRAIAAETTQLLDACARALRETLASVGAVSSIHSAAAPRSS